MKHWARHLFLLLVFANSQLGAQELDIKRAKKSIKDIQEDGLPAGWQRLGDDLFKVRFNLPYFNIWMYDEDYKSEPADDPFGGGGGPSIRKLQSAQQALEEVGIPFGELASATYDPDTGIVTIVNTANNIALVDVYAGSIMGSGPPMDIAVRVEIYDVTKLQALQLQESAESTGDHTPERNAALAAARDGKAKLATTVSMTTSIGQRAKLTDATAFLYPTRTPPEKGEKEATGFDYNEVGTIMEIEPTVDADGQTISLNIAVDHHTGPPEFDTVIDGLAAPKFHVKSLQTNVKLLAGDYLLLGTWTPSGKAEYADGDIVQVAFVTATIQQEPWEWGIITKEEEG